jgi:hypothetical protein
MNKTVAYCSLLVVGGLLAAIAICKPHLLSDENHFLNELVGVNLLLVAGVILTITLASAGQIHLTLNEIEARHDGPFLTRTRAGVHDSAYWLIAHFLASVAVVTTKHYFESVESQAIFNAIALLILFWMVLIMTSLTRLIFAIKPHYRSERDD